MIRTFRRLPKTKGLFPTFSNKSYQDKDYYDHSWRQHNHIWTDDEIKLQISSSTKKFSPVKISDHILSGIMKLLYHSFNFVTGYKENNPSPKSIEWRLIILESVAGVPGFVGAGFRHFRSLRTLQRDHGMIFTLLEEAENERMHLLTCLEMFKAGRVTRSLVVIAQFTLTPFLMFCYMIYPPSLHRFVGYLEETAVGTYCNVVKNIETPGTKLHEAWSTLPAPDISVHYWHLPEGKRTWLDALKRMLADEAHHRDVNHTLASLPPDADNPFVEEHMKDFDQAVLRRMGVIKKNKPELK